MSFFPKFRRRILTVAALAAASASTAGSAEAHHTAAYRVTTVVQYEYAYKPSVRYVTKYAPCGTAYVVKVVEYQKVRVPTVKHVKVLY